MSATTAKDLMLAAQKRDGFGRDLAMTEEHKRLAAKLNQEAQDNWDSAEWHRQVAADIAQTLDYGFQFDNTFGNYIRVQNLGLNDRYVIRERKGLKVFWTSRGGYINESQLQTERFEVPRDTLGFHVSEHEDKLRLGFAETIDALATLGQQRMDAEVNRRILTMATEAVPTGSDYYVATNGLTKDVLDQAIREVRDNIRPSGAGPVPVTILARSAMLDVISDFPGYAYNALEEIRLRGQLGVYRGANLQLITHYQDEEGVDFQPANEVWVMGGDAGTFINFGGTIVKQWTENTVDYVHYRSRKDVGGLIHRPETIRRIVDASVAP